MNNFDLSRVAFLNFLWAGLSLVYGHNADAQNQVLTKQNGGVSWESAFGGGANVRAKRTTNQTIPSGANTTVTFSLEDYDINNTFNPSTGIFKPFRAGYYVIKASVNWSSSNTTFGERTIRIYKNGTADLVYQNSEEGSGSMHSSIHTLVYSDGSDDYRVVVRQSSGSNHDISGSTSPGGGTTFTAYSLPTAETNNFLKRDAGGASWMSSKNVYVKARNNILSSIPNGGTKLTYNIEDYDDDNSFNPSTGVFTPPEAGYYVIMASVNWVNISNTSIIQLKRNLTTRIDQNSELGSGKTQSSIHTIIYSDGTDNYSIHAWQGTGASVNTSFAEFTAFKIQGSGEEILEKANGGVSWSELGSIIKAKRTSNMSIPSGTNTKITYSSEDFDVNSEFNLSTGVFTPNQAGYYAIMATANWNGANTTSGERGIRLVKRTGIASTILQKANYELGSSIMTSSLHTVVYYDGTSGHTYYVEAFQDSGSSHDIGGSSVVPGCTFTVFKL